MTLRIERKWREAQDRRVRSHWRLHLMTPHRLLCVAAALLWAVIAHGQLADTFLPSRDHPSIGYATRTTNDPIALLNRALQEGTARLTFDPLTGYLSSVLSALAVRVDSQVLVFSKTSLQADSIDPRNPRAIYFSDRVAVAATRGGRAVEIASVDPEQGVIFYVLEPRALEAPRFRRRDTCLECHISPATLGVPGLAVGSVFPEPDGVPISTSPTYVIDHRSPIEHRWGGWYVTGSFANMRHMGNSVVPNPAHPTTLVANAPTPMASLAGRLDLAGYLSPHSDLVALMVLEHQTHMTNLLTRVGWESRYALHEKQPMTLLLSGLVRDVVDYMLFIDEAPFTGPIVGSSRFAERFAEEGPNDSKGRTLHALDLERRLLRYPCSYMIYSPTFDALPAVAKDAIYKRLWHILSGAERDPRYARLTPTDRRAIIEILRDTTRDLPAEFNP